MPLPQKPDYTSPDGIFQFFRNPDDGLQSYLVRVNKKDQFYIVDGALGDLTNPEIPTNTAMRSLEAMCGGTIKVILSDNKITPEQLHIALLQLRITEGGRELERVYAATQI